MSPSESISPTAHYTGYVWTRNGLSHPEFETAEGRLLFETVRPVTIASRLLGGPSLEPYLLARHRAIDALLTRAIESGEVSQVIEVASGLSPRGWRFMRRFGDRITYVEADLPSMAERKQRILERLDDLSSHHRVEVVDALKDDDEHSLAAVAATLDPGSGLAIITEGLLGYLDWPSVDGIWRHFAAALKGFKAGRYISDLHLGSVQNAQIRAFRVILSAFVRGRVHLHFASAEDAEEKLGQAGFAGATVRPAAEIAPGGRGAGSELAHILEAST